MTEADDGFDWNPSIVTPTGESVEFGPGGYVPDHRDPDVLREMYVERDMAASEIARELGCGASTLLTALRRHGFEIEQRPDVDAGRGHNRALEAAADAPGASLECPDCGMLHRDAASQQACVRRHARETAEALAAEGWWPAPPDGGGLG